MTKHLVMLTRILWWGYILEAFWGDRWYQIWWGEYAPYTRLQCRDLPNTLSQYYSQQWYHAHLIKNKAFSVYLNGSFCHVEIELYFTPKWRTLQFFIRKQPHADLSYTRGELPCTTWGRFFNTFTNRDHCWADIFRYRIATIYHPACNTCNKGIGACTSCDYYDGIEKEVS